VQRVSLFDEHLLEALLGGRNVVWWLALTGILLTVRYEILRVASKDYVHCLRRILSIARGGNSQLGTADAM
jgi:hypothetical protein